MWWTVIDGLDLCSGNWLCVEKLSWKSLWQGSREERGTNEVPSRQFTTFFIFDLLSYCSALSKVFFWSGCCKDILLHRKAGRICTWSTQPPLHLFSFNSTLPVLLHPPPWAAFDTWIASYLDIQYQLTLSGLHICSMQSLHWCPTRLTAGPFYVLSLIPHSQWGHILSWLFIPLLCYWHSIFPGLDIHVFAWTSAWSRMAVHQLKINPSKTGLLYILVEASRCQGLVISLGISQITSCGNPMKPWGRWTTTCLTLPCKCLLYTMRRILPILSVQVLDEVSCKTCFHSLQVLSHHPIAACLLLTSCKGPH